MKPKTILSAVVMTQMPLALVVNYGRFRGSKRLTPVGAVLPLREWQLEFANHGRFSRREESG